MQEIPDLTKLNSNPSNLNSNPSIPKRLQLRLSGGLFEVRRHRRRRVGRGGVGNDSEGEAGVMTGGVDGSLGFSVVGSGAEVGENKGFLGFAVFPGVV